MRDVLRTAHFVVRVDEIARVVWRVRTEEKFESLGQIEGAYDALVRAFNTLDRPKLGQLVDVRRAPPRNDPQFEGAVRRHHVDLYRGFRASAALVQTAAGKLQMKRMLEASGVVVGVFTEDAEALAYLSRA